jgi:MATE family multidrug resistance protein
MPGDDEPRGFQDVNSSTEVTTARVFAIAGPAMLANLTTPLLGIVSTAAIGRLGEARLLGGVAVASVAFDCLFWLFSFLRLGTVAFTAQALGAQDRAEINAVLARGLITAAIIGAVLLALQSPYATVVFALVGADASVTAAARLYFSIRMWSAPFLLANYVLLGWFVGLARMRTALSLQVLINAVNIVATVALVIVFDFGIAGAATAAALAEATGCLCGFVAARPLFGSRLAAIRGILFERRKLKQLLSVNRDIMIRTASLIAGFFFFTAQGARAGDVTLAANAVLNNFIMIGSFFLDGLAAAAEQLCGQSVGARDAAAFARAARLVSGWSFGFGVALTVAFLLFGHLLIDLMAASPEVRAAAGQFLFYAALAPTCAVMAYCFDGIYIGATWTRDMRNLMLAALATYLVAWMLLRGYGNAGLWIALLIFLLSRGLYQAARFPSLVRRSFMRSP